MGASSALNVVAAVELGLKLGKGQLRPSHNDWHTYRRGLSRFEGGNDTLRWGLPVSEPPLLQAVARKQGVIGRYPVRVAEVYCAGLDHPCINITLFIGINNPCFSTNR